MGEFLISLWCCRRWQFRPNLCPQKKIFFYLIPQEFCDFFGTWDLHYLVFFRIQFLHKFWLQETLLASGAFHLSQNSKFWRIFQTVCFSYWKTTSVQSFSKINQNLWAQAPHPFPLSHFKKGAISWMLNQYEKLTKFLTSQPQMLFWRNLSQIYIWIRSFIWQKLGT